MRAAIDDVIRPLQFRRFAATDLRAILDGLVADGLDGRYRDYAGAEQATMAIASLLDWLVKQGAVRDVRAANRALDALYDTVKNDEKYQPDRYREALAGLARSLGS